MNGSNPPMLFGPVDVDTGGFADSPPTATAIVVRNPYGHDEASQQQPRHPNYVPTTHAHAAPYDDSMTVTSKPNSLASYPSATTTSDMTPVVSNVTFQ
eukprot:CAMPEP_0198142924 /NCGR_PEP_ID=MMETSP1443-20131203/5596_1 /TAXON_ID=186043 /ORGANISM="Entomoneis sp., Strain CCMP2396" /LENGTH=97 /DNA_ID=CAMNT_0043806051 /DNA_START=254 /DNA_END=544 /DNA_ORIENTATION=-